ncbi:MAG: BNR-4 repeat-containing protein [Puniceicoccaceae bacterium]
MIYIPERFLKRTVRWFSYYLILQGVPFGLEGVSFTLSEEGSGRATAYLESPKIVSFSGKTHVAWLDSPSEGFRVRTRTLDQESGAWSEVWTIGEATDNHGGPALTIDQHGYLHVLYYSHHHPFRYRRSVRPNDASEWTDYEEFGTNLTYPALVCAKDGTLIMVARRSYDEQPWELELWRKPPGEAWQRQGAILRSRHGIYAQFAASLAWGPDHQTLHLGTRIYEMPEDDMKVALSTVAYLVSPNSGKTWFLSNGKQVELPATADTADIIARGNGRENRILHAGSIGVDEAGKPYLPYGVRIQESCQAYLASPMEEGGWKNLHLNPFLPSEFRDWDLFMHGGIAFGSSGQPTLVGTVMQVPIDEHEWGHPTTELVCFRSPDGANTFKSVVLHQPDPESPRWMPNIERPTGFNQMPAYPSFIYTDGVRGDTLDDQLSNKVIWQDSEAIATGQ